MTPAEDPVVGPDTIPFAQNYPAPLCTWINQSRNATGWTTAVARLFDADVGYCGRCPRSQCNAAYGFCLVSVEGFIPDAEAADLVTLDFAFVGPPEDLGSRGADGGMRT
jgi:hypothetical protein